MQLLDDQLAIMHQFVFNGLTQGRAKWVLTDDPDDDRRIGRSKSVGRPLGEFDEIVDERGLDLVFRRAARLLDPP